MLGYNHHISTGGTVIASFVSELKGGPFRCTVGVHHWVSFSYPWLNYKNHYSIFIYTVCFHSHSLCNICLTESEDEKSTWTEVLNVSIKRTLRASFMFENELFEFKSYWSWSYIWARITDHTSRKNPLPFYQPFNSSRNWTPSLSLPHWKGVRTTTQTLTVSS